MSENSSWRREKEQGPFQCFKDRVLNSQWSNGGTQLKEAGGKIHTPHTVGGRNHTPHTVDGRNSAPVDRYFPIIYKVLYIPGGAGFLPSTVGIIDQQRNSRDFSQPVDLWHVLLRALWVDGCWGCCSFLWILVVFLFFENIHSKIS